VSVAATEGKLQCVRQPLEKNVSETGSAHSRHGRLPVQSALLVIDLSHQLHKTFSFHFFGLFAKMYLACPFTSSTEGQVETHAWQRNALRQQG